MLAADKLDIDWIWSADDERAVVFNEDWVSAESEDDAKTDIAEESSAVVADTKDGTDMEDGADTEDSTDAKAGSDEEYNICWWVDCCMLMLTDLGITSDNFSQKEKYSSGL